MNYASLGRLITSVAIINDVLIGRQLKNLDSFVICDPITIENKIIRNDQKHFFYK